MVVTLPIRGPVVAPTGRGEEFGDASIRRVALMKSHAVGRGVGDVRHEGPACAEPLNMGLPGVN